MATGGDGLGRSSRCPREVLLLIQRLSRVLWIASLFAVAVAVAAVPARAQEQILVDVPSTMRYLSNSSDPGIGVA